jgi:flagellar hook-length control protein FliK
MNTLPTNLMPTPTSTAPLPGSGAQGREGTAPGFAQCLGEATGREAPVREDPAAPPTSDDADAPEDSAAREPAAPSPSAPGARRTPHAPGLRRADAAAKNTAATPDMAAKAVPADAAAAIADPAAAGKADRADEAPDLGELLPGWVPAPATPVPATAAAAARDTAARSEASRALGGLQRLVPGDAPSDAKGSKPDAPAAATFALPAAATPATPSAPAAPDAPTPAHAHVAAPVDSPAFAPALATQVRWLVRDGLQHAQLSLNPAEMGPVTVQIVLDGREARIDFRADLAATRSAIESSLPVLAAALDDSGLRLTGGGVHDGQTSRHPQGTMAQGGSSPGASGRGAVTLDDEAPARTVRGAAGPARGLVDLVA